jgi:hypothetical protein
MWVLNQRRSTPHGNRLCRVSRFYVDFEVHPLNKLGDIIFSRSVGNEWLSKRIPILLAIYNILVVDGSDCASVGSGLAISIQNSCLDDWPSATTHEIYGAEKDSEDVLDENIQEPARHENEGTRIQLINAATAEVRTRSKMSDLPLGTNLMAAHTCIAAFLYTLITRFCCSALESRGCECEPC